MIRSCACSARLSISLAKLPPELAICSWAIRACSAISDERRLSREAQRCLAHRIAAAFDLVGEAGAGKRDLVVGGLGLVGDLAGQLGARGDDPLVDGGGAVLDLVGHAVAR